MDKVCRPALRYFGGKWKIAPWVIANLPAHETYCEPFGGAASVLLRKEPCGAEIYNDASERLVSFFRVLRERPDELMRAIELTPYSRVEFQRAQEECEDELEAARRWFVWSWQGRGRPGVRESWFSWGYRVKDRSRERMPYEHLLTVARRLRRVQIECDDALSVIGRYDGAGTLFYVDPPYVAGTRGKSWGTRAYVLELGEEGHVRLARALRGIRGRAVVSGYPSALYAELYRGWRCVTRPARRGGVFEATECLWVGPAGHECH